MLPIINLVIGIVFTFLLFSLVLSALNELILSALDKRAKFLEEGLAELLGDPNKTPNGPLTTFLKHGLVDALSRKVDGEVGKPSYIPGKVFVSALLDQISKATPDALRTVGDIKDGIKKMPASLQESMTAIFDEAEHDLARFKAGIETWFNQGMERVSGWYKRYAQQWMFFLGLGLAIGCNVDTVHIIQALSSDPKLRDSMVTQAIGYVKENSPAPQQAGVKTNDLPAVDTKEVMAKVQKVEGSLARMNATGLPLGWGDTQLAYFREETGAPLYSRIFLALFGWLVTALAGSLGAPFWFDTLNRFINIRGNGRAPEEGDPTNPKGNPVPKTSQ